MPEAWFVVRVDGRLDRSAAARTLAAALQQLGSTGPADHVVWGVVQADRESVARVMDPPRWYGAGQ
jgi:hypothetical protein